MGVSDVTKIQKIPGKLVVDPTNLAAAFPYGGTELGAVRQVALKLRYQALDVPAEEFDEPCEFLLGACKVLGLGAVLRQYDDKVLTTVFPSTSTGSSSGEKGVDWPGTARAGALGSARAVKLLFVPNNSAHPGILLYKAVPCFTGEVEVMHEILGESAFAVLFRAMRDAASPPKVGVRKKLVDMTL